MTPTVSIVMAAKNYARFLAVAIDSAQAQTWTDWEMVIVDDGSTDATPEVVRPYLSDRRIRYYRSDRLGQSRAKNLGIGLTRGEYIAYLDADDAWLPSKLERQLALFRNDPRVGVVFCGRKIIDEAGAEIPRAAEPSPPRGMVLEPLFLKNFVCFSSVVVRREVFDRVGRFDLGWDLAIDYDLWLRVAPHYHFDYVDERLVLYRTGHGNLSKKLSDRVATAVAIMNRAVDRRGLGERLPRHVIGEGYASTLRALGYTLRRSEPWMAAKWYAEALTWPGRRMEAFRGLTASILHGLRGSRVPAAPENAAVNR